MIDHLTTLLEKAAIPVVSATGIFGGLVLASGGPVESWGAVWEKGGMALVIVICIYAIGKASVPPMANWVKGYLEGLESRNADTQKRWETRMDASQVLFLDSMRQERESRKATEEAFTRSLENHKSETVSAIHVQTDVLRTLTEQLGERPCQIHVASHQTKLQP